MHALAILVERYRPAPGPRPRRKPGSPLPLPPAPRRRSLPDRLPRQMGAFLIALAVTVPMAAIILGSFAERSFRNLEAAHRFRGDATALHVAKGGIEKALWMLGQDPDWRTGFADVSLGAGAYTVIVEDSSDVPSLLGLIRIRAVGTAPSARGFSSRDVAVMAGTRAIRTVAGNGSDVWNGDGLSGPDTAIGRPHAVAMDPMGNLWFSTQSRIRRLDGVTGFVTTPVGAGYGSLGAGDDLGDEGPASAALFDDPTGICFTADGMKMYIADSGNGVIRMVNFGVDPIPVFGTSGFARPVWQGEIDTVAGSWPPGYSGDGGYALEARFGADLGGVGIDGDGLLIVSDATNNRVRAINTSTLLMFTVGPVMLLPYRIDTVYGNGTTLYGSDGAPALASGMSNPGPATFDALGDIWVPIGGHNQVFKVNRLMGTLQHMAGDWSASGPFDDGPALLAGLGGPSGLALFGDGSWILASRGYHTIREVDGAGAIRTVAGRTSSPGFRVEDGPATIAKCNWPTRVLADQASPGDFYFTDRENHRIRHVTREIVVYNYAEN